MTPPTTPTPTEVVAHLRLPLSARKLVDLIEIIELAHNAILSIDVHPDGWLTLTKSPPKAK